MAVIQLCCRDGEVSDAWMTRILMDHVLMTYAARRQTREILRKRGRGEKGDGCCCNGDLHVGGGVLAVDVEKDEFAGCEVWCTIWSAKTAEENPRVGKVAVKLSWRWRLREVVLRRDGGVERERRLM
jgi:hypothetical protein